MERRTPLNTPKSWKIIVPKVLSKTPFRPKYMTPVWIRKYETDADAYIALAKSDSISAFAPRGLCWARKAQYKKNLMGQARTLCRRVIDQCPGSWYAYKAIKHLNAKNTTRLTGWQRPIDFSYAPPAVDLIASNDRRTQPCHSLDAATGSIGCWWICRRNQPWWNQVLRQTRDE